MARGENCLTDERPLARSKARGLLLGDYRPDSPARREKAAERFAEQEATRRAEEAAQRAAEKHERALDAWSIAAEGTGCGPYFEPAAERDERFSTFRDPWVASGLEPEVGVAWIEAYRSRPYEQRIAQDVKSAVRNHQAGITPEFARPLLGLNRRLSTKQLLGFKQLVDDGKLADNHAAARWLHAGHKPDEVSDWLELTDNPGVARAWAKLDIAPEERAAWFAASGGSANLTEWGLHLGWSAERLGGWTSRIPFPFLTAQVLEALDRIDMEPQELDDWEAQGYSVRAGAPGGHPASLVSLLELAGLGLSAEQGGVILARRQRESESFAANGRGRHEVYSLPESRRLDLQETGMTLPESVSWYEAGFSPREALRWLEREVQPHAAAVYAELGLGPDDELPHRG